MSFKFNPFTGTLDIVGSTGGGGSGVDTVGAFSASPQTDGATIAGTAITFGPASATIPGMVSTGAQTLAGAKTFNGIVSVSSGAVATPSLGFSADSATSGFYRVSANRTGYSANGSLVFDWNATGQVGIGTGSGNTSVLTLGGALTTGASQRGVSLTPTFSSAATSGGTGVSLSLSTAAAAFTQNIMQAVSVGTMIKGAGSTITRAVNLTGGVQTVGTNNAFITDNNTWTGNFFINQAGTEASLFSGLVTVANLVDNGLTVDTVPYVNGSKQITSSSVTQAELEQLATNTFADITVTNSIDFNSQLSVETSPSNAIIDILSPSGVLQIKTAGNSRLYIADDKPQFSVLGADIFLEEGDGGAIQGSIGALTPNASDIGYVERQQDVNFGFTPFRNIALSNDLYFIPSSEASSYDISSSAVPRLDFTGTIGSANTSFAWTNARAMKFYSNAAGDRYFEMYLGLSGLNFMQTNQDLCFNYDGHGALIVCDSNASPNGKRLETVTLSAGSVVKSNNSVTANTVLMISCSNPSAQGFLSYTVSAGVGYTITSTSVLDASELKVFLIENGR